MTSPAAPVNVASALVSPLEVMLVKAARTLAEAGITSAREDAEALAAYSLGLMVTAELSPTTSALGPSFEQLVTRRAQRVPLPHLLGLTSFRGISLQVGPGVFTPQPETSALVQWAVEALAEVANPLIADLCTGAGTVALALANEVPGITVHAVERDPAALAWAYRNADARALLGDPPVALHLGDAASCLAELNGQLDLVASNPPYVGTSEAHLPDPEVLEHDPEIALWAGTDGLDIIRLVESSAARLVKDGGWVCVEHSDRQGVSAPAVFTSSGAWEQVTDHRDQEGRDRFVTARRKHR